MYYFVFVSRLTLFQCFDDIDWTIESAPYGKEKLRQQFPVSIGDLDFAWGKPRIIA